MPNGSTRFHLVRHGHTDALGHTLTGRSPGVGLSAQGSVEAAQLARALSTRPLAAILSSPQRRAMETATPIAALAGLEVRVEPTLDEVDFGAWAGARFAELDPLPDWQAWNRLRSLSPGAGETMLAVQARAVSLVQRLHAAFPNGELVLVSHADVLKSLLAHMLGLPIDLMQRIELDPAGRSIVVLSSADVRVEAVNLPPSA